MEDQVKMIAIYRNLMYYFLLLEVEEVLKNLLLCFLMITLSHKCQASHFNFSLIKQWLVNYFVQHVWVLGIPDLLVNLSEFASFEQLVEHAVRSLLHRM